MIRGIRSAPGDSLGVDSLDGDSPPDVRFVRAAEALSLGVDAAQLRVAHIVNARTR
ncbi:MAG: hypothetical protein AAFQ77_01165 [Myxococcota bacterium]